MTDTLREKVAKAKYEQKRARLLEAFGDTAGWPKWDTLKPTLKEIEMEDCDFYIALVLEEAAKVAENMPHWTDNGHPLGMMPTGRNDIAAAIRAMLPK